VTVRSPSYLAAACVIVGAGVAAALYLHGQTVQIPSGCVAKECQAHPAWANATAAAVLFISLAFGVLVTFTTRERPAVTHQALSAPEPLSALIAPRQPQDATRRTMADAWARGTKKRIALTTLLISSLILTPLTYVLDAAGGHPAKSAPIVLWIGWFVILFPARLLVAAGRRRRAR
jgi:hypothetical protein